MSGLESDAFIVALGIGGGYIGVRLAQGIKYEIARKPGEPVADSKPNLDDEVPAVYVNCILGCGRVAPLGCFTCGQCACVNGCGKRKAINQLTCGENCSPNATAQKADSARSTA